MEAETYSNVRNNLKHFMKKVNEDVELVIITSKNNDENAILISKKELKKRCYIASYKHISSGHFSFYCVFYKASASCHIRFYRPDSTE